MKHKSELIGRLEVKTTAMTDTLQKLDNKYVECESEKTALENKLSKFQVDQALWQDIFLKNAELEKELKKEKECRLQAQASTESINDNISQLSKDLMFYKQVARDYEGLQSEHEKLHKEMKEKDCTLAEIGGQLSEAKLQVVALKEEASISVVDKSNTGQWIEDADVRSCQICEKEFNLSRRKHHCRHCGGIYCDSCSYNKLPLPSSAKPVRVCDNCYEKLLEHSG